MQEELEQKSVAISIKAGKLTANLLKKALEKALAEMTKSQKNPKIYKGKQSVKHLVPVSYTHLDVYKRQGSEGKAGERRGPFFRKRMCQSQTVPLGSLDAAGRAHKRRESFPVTERGACLIIRKN